MPHLTTDDGVKLYYEETGSGIPIVFVHEFAGDYRAWEPQVRYFSRRYRCITYNARGYPPSDVPKEPGRYSQDRARDDIRAVLDALKIDKAHIVGLSMGGFATLHFGFTYPDRARSLVIAGCGYGAEPDKRAHEIHDLIGTKPDEILRISAKEGRGVPELLEAVVKRPVVVSDERGADAVAIRPMANLCMSWDHRALDGALAARFLSAVRRNVEG